MGWPQKEAVIKPLGTNNAGMKVANVALLGFKGKLQWTQGADGLKVQMPPARPCDHAITLKISGA
jgi:alpha-L-fucosidase